jgi:hypothetical protein
MDMQKIVPAIIGGVVAGFSIGVGFLIAQRSMGTWILKKEAKKSDSVADAVKDGVKEGIKEVQASNFAAANAQGGRGGRRPSRGNGFYGFDGFNGDARKMGFSGDPLKFGKSPNSRLNSY